MAVRDSVKAVLKSATGAAGLASSKKGFAWEPDYDSLFALGWPHLRLVVADHEDDRDATKWANTAIGGSIEGHYLVEWPEQVALRYVRAFGGRGAGAWSAKNEHVAACIAAEATPPSEDEVRQMLADRVKRGGPTGSWFTEHFVLLLEAFVGTEVVLDGLTSALEGDVGGDEEVEQYGFVLGFLLLRVAPKVAAKQRARLQAVLEKTPSSDYLYDGLACALGGGEAARSMGNNPIYYHHAIDDPDGVRQAVAAGKWLPSARHVFIGGDPVLEIVVKSWNKQKDAELQRKLATQLAPISSPLAVRILAEMAAKSKAKKDLPRICAPFAKHMKADLEALTGDKAAGPGAKALLAAAE